MVRQIRERPFHQCNIGVQCNQQRTYPRHSVRSIQSRQLGRRHEVIPTSTQKRDR